MFKYISCTLFLLDCRLQLSIEQEWAKWILRELYLSVRVHVRERSRNLHILGTNKQVASGTDGTWV